MIVGKRILVVEDEFIVAAMLRDTLEDEGAVPLGPAGRVADALALVDEGNIDLVVLDWNLGGETSTPVAEALASRGVPFLISTGYGSVGGAFANRPVVTKPYAPQALIAALTQLLQS